MTMLTTDPEPGIGADAEVADAGVPSPYSTGDFDILADLRKELEQLSAANQAIFEQLHSDPVVNLDAATPMDAAGAERRPLFVPATTPSEWAQRQAEYEARLQEQSETIQALNLRIEQYEQGLVPALDPEQIHDAAVQRLRKQLEEQRRQLEEDEEALQRQMREMELAMAKDRADLARQRNELLRLQADFQRELETASRDPELRERLIGLQRRQQENQRPRTTPPPMPVPALPSEPPRPRSSILRRLFGQNP